MKLVGSLLFAFAFSVSGSSLAAEALFDSSDVSALLPLPDPEHPLSSDIRLSDVGIKGAIFSKQNFERLPLVVVVNARQANQGAVPLVDGLGRLLDQVQSLPNTRNLPRRWNRNPSGFPDSH